MTADPTHSAPGPELPIPDSAARQIASSFTLSVADVSADAREVSMWQGPMDDLLQWLKRRHGFRTRSALAYLISLRVALSGKSDQPTV
jgi:hypothetical protein